MAYPTTPRHETSSRHSRTFSGSPLVALLVLLVPALAWALAGTSFEGADGDLVPAAGLDWQSFATSPRLSVGHDAPSGQADDSLRGKEDDVAPGIDFGSIPSNKSDLLRFYSYHERVMAGDLPRDFLHLAWVRSDTLGTANMDFEFNQSSVLTSNGMTVERTPGDMLVTFGFSGGGNQVNLSLSRWTASGPCEAASTGPCWGPVQPLAGIAEGAVNVTDSVFDPIEGTTLLPLTFGEATIDLTAAGVFDTDACVSFGRGHVSSRSSDSFSSSLKDFIKPVDVKVANCGTITIRKQAVPLDAQDFSFTASPALGVASFLLDDDGAESNALPSSRTFQGRFEGTIEITEEGTEGWDLADVTCSSGGVPEHSADGTLTGKIAVDAGPGDTVECA